MGEFNMYPVLILLGLIGLILGIVYLIVLVTINTVYDNKEETNKENINEV